MSQVPPLSLDPPIKRRLPRLPLSFGFASTSTSPPPPSPSPSPSVSIPLQNVTDKEEYPSRLVRLRFPSSQPPTHATDLSPTATTEPRREPLELVLPPSSHRREAPRHTAELLGGFLVTLEDCGRQVSLNTDGLPRRFTPPPPSSIPSSLLAGRGSFVAADGSAGTFGDLLWVATRSRLRQDLREYAFVSFRNNFNKLLEAVWQQRDGWCVEARRVGGTVFLGVRERGAEEVTDGMYAGYKFEDVCTRSSGEPSAAIDPQDGQYCGVFSVTIGPFRCLLGAELDCHDGERFVELKTCPEFQSRRHEQAYRGWRLRKQWIQSAIVGVPLIFTGFKDGHTLVRTHMTRTADIPSMAIGWSPQQALSSALDILSFLHANVASGSDYLLHYIPPEGPKPRRLLLEQLSPDRPSFLNSSMHLLTDPDNS